MSQETAKTVMPIIAVDSVDDARAYYLEKLGFGHMMGMLGKDGKLDFCTVVLGGARVMLTRAQGASDGTGHSSTPRPVELYLEVDDVQGYHDQLKKRGVKIVAELETQWWGDRTFTVQDPYGYRIWFFQQVGQPKPPTGAKIV